MGRGALKRALVWIEAVRPEMPIAGAMGDKRKEAEEALAAFKLAVGDEREYRAQDFVYASAAAEADFIYFSFQPFTDDEINDRITSTKKQVRDAFGDAIPRDVERYMDGAISRSIIRRLGFLRRNISQGGHA